MDNNELWSAYSDLGEAAASLQFAGYSSLAERARSLQSEVADILPED